MPQVSLMLAEAVKATDLITKVKTNIFNPLITLGFGVALIIFLWGVAEAIRNARSDEGRTTGRTHMLWGIFGMFIMVSAFGIMNLICQTIGCA